MASTYSTLKIQLMATGENSTTWGTVTNTNLGTAIEEAIVGSADIAFSNANVTLTLTDTNSSQPARNMRLNLTGSATAGYNLIVPSIEKPYIVNNGTDGTITVKNSTGTGIAVPAGKTMWVYNNGTNVVDVVTHLSSLTLGAPLPIASGGTGGNTAANARTALGLGSLATESSVNLTTQVTDVLPIVNGGTGAATAGAARTALGATTVGSNFFTLTNPSAITFPRINADNTVSALNAADFRTAIGAGSGAGSVTSVNVTTSISGLAFSGGPVTTSGTMTLALDNAATFRSTIGAAASGANTDITALDQDVTITATGTIAATSIGYRGLPQSSNTTLALADAGKHIYTSSNVTIPANSGTAFPVGTTIVIANSGSGTLTISITSDTLRQAGTTNTGTRTLAAYGLATLVKVTSTVWFISGNVS